MKLNNPIVSAEKVFDEAALNLAISPIFRTNFLSASASLTLIPIRRLENGDFEAINDPATNKHLIYPDIFLVNDADVTTCVTKVQAAIQELLNKKGI